MLFPAGNEFNQKILSNIPVNLTKYNSFSITLYL